MRNQHWYVIEGRTSQSRYESFYDGSFLGDLLFRARAKSLEVKSRVSRWKNGGYNICMMREKGVDEAVKPLMLECERYEYARIMMLAEEIGVQEWSEMRERSVSWRLVVSRGSVSS